MCGISGYFLKNNVEIRSDSISRMLELQKHRGPDDSGILGINTKNNSYHEISVSNLCDFNNYPNLILGFNRLSILDLSSAGHQPMINHASNVVLMMNGEVYNAFDFKSSLIEKGYFFNGNSDTEVVLNLYLEYGINGMLNRLNGMFAIAIYDGRSKDFYLIRDRMGIKPLYVFQDQERIAFSSEIKSFKALPNFHFQLDEQNLSEFLLFRNLINNTLFKGIINITPGSYWKISETGDVEINSFYDIRSEGINNKMHYNHDNLEKALKHSVNRQMISDVKLGSQLSGGVDSSLVTAFASENLSKGSLETVSIIFQEKSFSEKKYIDIVANKFKLESHQFTLTASDYLDLIDEAVWHFEQPLNHPNTIGIKLLSREAKKHVTVLFGGEGADETLAGYNRFLPHSSDFFSINTLKRAIKNKKYFFDFLWIWKSKEIRYLMQSSFGNFANASAIYSKFSYKKALENRLNVWNSINDRPGRKMRKYEILTYLPDLLMRQDKMSMAHTIENRVPFLDNEFVEIAMGIDDVDLVKKRKGKWEGKFLLKEICSSVFDKDFAFRGKMGFGIPLKVFFDSEQFQKRWNQEILPGIKNRGIFKAESLVEWMIDPKKMTPEQLDALWLMLGFEIWAKQYLD